MSASSLHRESTDSLIHHSILLIYQDFVEAAGNKYAFWYIAGYHEEMYPAIQF